EEGEYYWDSTVQGSIPGPFHWSYFLSQVVRGILTQKIGTKALIWLLPAGHCHVLSVHPSSCLHPLQAPHCPSVHTR
ncbi:hypothetical protein J6590_107835, partial [Homalodisca vitripennis]